jgi:lipoyl(octanoyl) transferase
MESWFFLEDGSHEPAWNMACDEWLLLHARELEKPLLRTYSWDRPSVTIGYFQEFPTEIAKTHTVIRRPTGGAMVFHDHDLTFSVVLPPDHPWKKLRPDDRYQKVHERISKVFELRGALPALAPELKIDLRAPLGREEAHARCFEKSSRYDVLIQNLKVAGGAQRVTKDGLLHQGSIQGSSHRRVSSEELLNAWKFFNSDCSKRDLSLIEQNQISILSKEKYCTTEWNRRVS